MPKGAGRSTMRRVAGGRTAKDYAIFVVYDGEKTEDEYFRGWKLVIPPSRLTLEHTFAKSGGNALEAVKAAVKLKKKAKDFAEFWCVCDVDDTSPECLREAESLAIANNVKLCLSNRCFEVWITLHFEFTDAVFANEQDAIERVSRHCAKYGAPYKSVAFYKLLEKTDDAISNAQKLDAMCSVNPRTSVHHLIRKFKQNLT